MISSVYCLSVKVRRWYYSVFDSRSGLDNLVPLLFPPGIWFLSGVAVPLQLCVTTFCTRLKMLPTYLPLLQYYFINPDLLGKTGHYVLPSTAVLFYWNGQKQQQWMVVATRELCLHFYGWWSGVPWNCLCPPCSIMIWALEGKCLIHNSYNAVFNSRKWEWDHC